MILQKDGGQARQKNSGQVGKTISHYKILEKLGEGGMGVVYKVEDTKLKRTVALKFLSHRILASEEDKSRFLHEAQSASALNHPNIMTIHAIDEVEGETFIAMELVEGETLKARLEKGLLRTKELLNIAIAMADGLHAAHEQGIVHRDIKSENVMISTKGRVKIMDFGIAKRKGMAGVTKMGMTPGTLAYMSPEQTEGLEVDHRSDLFSFGVVMYEMATGRVPFHGEHEAAILYSIVNEAPIPVSTLNPDIPEELGRIIHKALEKEAEDRFQHADDLLADLKKLKKDLDTGRTTMTVPHIPVPTEPERKGDWRKPIYILAAVIIVLILIFGAKKFSDSGVQSVITQENSLAVLYFENLKDPDDTERMGQIIQELIIADLSEISSLKMFSSQRLFDIQKRLGSKDRRKIDRDLATEVARQAGAQTMLTGNIIQAGDKMILTSQLVSVSEGMVIESQRVEGNDIYTMVDDLSVEIQNDLNLSDDEADRVDIAVKDKTTATVGAYQYYLAGVDLFNNSKFDSASVQFQKAISIDSMFTQAYYKLAIAQWWSQSVSGEGTSDQAEETLSHILSGHSFPSTKDKLMAEGAMAMIRQHWNEAQTAFEQMVSFIPDEKEAWFGLGEAYFHGIQDYVGALDAFERVLRMDPEFTQAYWHIFDIYYAMELFDRGLDRARQFVALYPEKSTGHFYLGRMFRGNDQYVRALSAFERAVELDPQFVSAYANIIDIFNKEGLYDQGIQYAEQTVDQHPDKPWSYGFLGDMYRGKGEFELALEAFQNGVMLDPQNYHLIENIGYIYQLMGRYQEANEKYSELLKDDITLDWQLLGLTRLSFLYSEQGQCRRALRLYDERYRISKSMGTDFEVGSLIGMAFISYILGDTTSTLGKLDRALVLKPRVDNILSIYLIKGLMRAQLGQEEALNWIIDTVEHIIEGEIVTKQSKGILNALLMQRFMLLGEGEKALKEYKNLSVNEELNDYLMYLKALLELRKGDYEEALATTRMMQSPTVSRNAHHYIYPRAFYVRGLIYEEMGDLALARENYERLLDLWQYGDEEIFERQDTMMRLSRIIRVQG